MELDVAVTVAKSGTYYCVYVGVVKMRCYAKLADAEAYAQQIRDNP
ncbi:hypothetical protein RugamoR57_37470 [Duganella caerulea]